MKKSYRNIFFVLGLIAIIVMLLTFDVDYNEIWYNVRRAGWWFVAVMGLWLIIYALNALSWMSLVNGKAKGEEVKSKIKFLSIYRYTITGFALNYATPCGLMGGEPYRIMEISPVVGGVRATSSVISYAMMHIFSHICFWLCSAVLFLTLYKSDAYLKMLMFAIIVVCAWLIYLFLCGYKNGLLKRTVRYLCRVPMIGNRMKDIYAKHEESFERVDRQIASLHDERLGTFIKAFVFEFVSRWLTSVEVFFIMKVVASDVSLLDSVMIMAFTSLFSNIFFFSPMQLGAREGGFALAIAGMSMSGGIGVFVGLISRVKELLWIVIGLSLMNIKASAKSSKSVKPYLPIKDKVQEVYSLEDVLAKIPKDVKVIMFDYGGTLDTHGIHWFEMFKRVYVNYGINISKETLWDTYVNTERTIEKEKIIEKDDTFKEVLTKKISIQLEDLKEHGVINLNQEECEEKVRLMSQELDDIVRENMEKTKNILRTMQGKYILALVSNYYGNLQKVIEDYGVAEFFSFVFDSTLVGYRKPSQKIYEIALEKMNIKPEEAVMIGDSYKNDIQPTTEIGMSAIWLKTNAKAFQC